jgi:hypothetical protein
MQKENGHHREYLNAQIDLFSGFESLYACALRYIGYIIQSFNLSGHFIRVQPGLASSIRAVLLQLADEEPHVTISFFIRKHFY